jgi:hypothetical protein
MDDFTQKIVLLVVDKLAIGLLILFIGYIITRAIEKFKSEQALRKDFEVMRDKTALEHLQRQIEELYSPLLGLIQYSETVYKILQKKLQVKAVADVEAARSYFNEKYFLPLNSKIATLLREKIYLLDTNELPPSFKQFLEHESQFASLHSLWKDTNIQSDEIDGIPYPQNFENDAKEALGNLMKRYNQYLKRLEQIPSNQLNLKKINAPE